MRPASAPPTCSLALVILVPVTLTTSALFLTIASFARDFRDGQTLLTPMYMAVVLPAAVVAMPTITLDAWTAFVPVVNVALLIKAAVPPRGRPPSWCS